MFVVMQSTLEDIAKFEAKLASVLPPSKALDQGDVSNVMKQEGRPSQVKLLLTYLRV